MTAREAQRQFVAYLWIGEAENSLAHQREAIARYASAHGLVPATEFCDRGGRGNEGIAERPRLADLLVAVAGDDVEVAIVESAERLSHDVVQRELALHELRRAGVAVFAADSGEELTGDARDPKAALIQRVLGAFAALDSHPGVAAARAAIASRHEASSGEKARDEIRRLRAQRASFTRIARHLNELGLVDPQGRPWTRMAVFEFQR